MYRNHYDEAVSEMYKYLQANNRVLNQNDEYQYKPTEKDINTLKRGVALANIRHYKGEPIRQYKGILHRTADDRDGESYLYKLYKQSLR